MQTPTKYALGILMVLCAISTSNPIANAHSESSVGLILAGTGDPFGLLPSLADACIDDTFQGYTSTCTAIFPDEQGHDMIFVAEGLTASASGCDLKEPQEIGLVYSHCAADFGLTATFYSSLNAPVPTTSYYVPKSGYVGDATCNYAANGGVAGDLVTVVPATAVKVAVGASIGTAHIAWWSFEPCTYY